MLSIYHFQPHQTLYKTPIKQVNTSEILTFYLLVANDHSIQKPTTFFKKLITNFFKPLYENELLLIQSLEI